MSKAEQRACEYTGYCRNQSYNDYLKGYHQAEKDLGLSWEDISIIRQIMFDYNKIIREQKPIHIPSDKDYCEEILRQYKERKENEVQDKV